MCSRVTQIAAGFALLTGLAAANITRAEPQPAATILAHAEKALAAMSEQQMLRKDVAEAITTRFLAGANLLISGSIPRFDIEWLNRAGGVMPVAIVKDPAKVGPQDVLLYGCLDGNDDDDERLLRPIHERGTLVVVFGSASRCPKTAAVADFFLPNCLPPNTPMQPQVAASIDIVQLWALTGEFVGACTRAGKMPTMWQSVMVDGARARNARYRPLRMHTDVQVPPQEPGRIGADYLDAIHTAIIGLKTQLHAIETAAAVLEKALADQHTVFHANLGHFEPIRLVPEKSPVKMKILTPRKEAQDLREHGRQGDALLCVWYTSMPTELLQAARDIGVTSICMVADNPQNPVETNLADLFIDPQWTFGDAAVKLPGYDVPILPPSGALNSIVFWTILAECTGD